MRLTLKNILTSISIGLLFSCVLMGQTSEPASLSGSLPAGHPDPGAAGPSGMRLPAGHPDISQMMQSNKPSTQPQSVTGTVTIHATQATAGGPAIGADDFAVEIYVQGELLDKIEGKLDEKGSASVSGLPLLLGPQPIVKVNHSGAVYQIAGQAMDGGTPKQDVQVPVYETSETAPDWHVRMRHVMVQRIAEGLQIIEMLAIDNPTDRAWIGTPSTTGGRATFTLDLPAEAQHVEVAGPYAAGARVDGNKLTNTMALVPGTTQYQFSYVLPVKSGKAAVTITAPAPVQSLIVMVPDDRSSVAATGIELSDTSDMGTGKTRFYRADDVKAGAQVALAFSGIADFASPAATHASSSPQVAQIVAAVGAVVILLFGVAFLFIKTAPKPAVSRSNRKA